MTKEKLDKFVAFLKSRMSLEDSELPVVGEWSNMGNTIGANALRTGLLSLEQVNNILIRQESEEEHQLFGQVAIQMAYLTPDDVDRLIAIQDLNMQLTLVGQMVLRGNLQLPCLLDIMRQYLAAESQTGAGQRVEETESAPALC